MPMNYYPGCDDADNLNRPAWRKKHHTFGELAKDWHLAPNTVKRLCMAEGGLLEVGEKKLRKGKKRTKVIRRVPEDVARRVYEKYISGRG